METMTEQEYKDICEQIEYEQDKYNRLFEEWRVKEKGMKVTINALQELKDQYEMRGDELNNDYF